MEYIQEELAAPADGAGGGCCWAAGGLGETETAAEAPAPDGQSRKRLHHGRGQDERRSPAAEDSWRRRTIRAAEPRCRSSQAEAMRSGRSWLGEAVAEAVFHCGGARGEDRRALPLAAPAGGAAASGRLGRSVSGGGEGTDGRGRGGRGSETAARMAASAQGRCPGPSSGTPAGMTADFRCILKEVRGFAAEHPCDIRTTPGLTTRRSTRWSTGGGWRSTQVPYGRCVVLQDLGRTYRVLRGEGAFAGERAYEEFQPLAEVFARTGPGLLVHPVWRTEQRLFRDPGAWMEEPLPDYVRYSFAFWEDWTRLHGGLAEVPVKGSQSGGTAPDCPPAGRTEQSIPCGRETPCGESPGGTACR